MAIAPPLSIVVPTKDRQEQCIATVQSVLAFDEAFELIVFDSSERGDILGQQLERLNDDRVRHVHVPALANMTECFEAAIEPARGSFVCMIGDDDGVTSALFDWTRRAIEEGLTSVTTDPMVYASYNWPGIRSKYFGDAASGKLFVRLDSRVATRIVNARTQIDGFLRAAGQGCGSMPRVYHGLVARPVLSQMAKTMGRCFDGVSPDVSFSYFAAHFSPRHAIIGTPLTIGGASVSSNAGRSAMRQHKGDLWSDPHMRRYAGEPWPPEVPEFFSVETVWGQATLRALARAGNNDRSRFNDARFYSLLLLRHPDRWRATVAALATRPFLQRLRAAVTLVPVAAEHAFGAARKIIRRFRPDRSVQTLDAASIGTASTLVDQVLADFGAKA